MKRFHSIKYGFWRLFWIVFYIGILIACFYLAFAYYYSFNFEELNIPDYVSFLATTMAPIFILYHYLERSKVDMERKMVVRKTLLGKATEIPFEKITGYKFFKSWGTISVSTDVVRWPINIRKQSGYDDFLDWLEANRPIQKPDRFNFGVGWWTFLVAYFLLSILSRAYRDPINDYVRYNFPFNPVETVEISGVYKKRRFRGLEEKGPYAFMSFELSEYPDLRFGVSTYLPDEVPVDLPRDLSDSLVYLTINKSDFDMVIDNKSAFFLKESVRTYEVRTEHQLFLKKNLSLLK